MSFGGLNVPKRFLNPSKFIELLLPIQLSACANSVVGINFQSTPLKIIDATKATISWIIPPPIAIRQESFLTFFSKSRLYNGTEM